MANVMTTANSAVTIRSTIEKVIAELREELFGTYRPERHYMRGPGPKCRARDQHSALAG
jgi:hypothetical protein